jgi:hypothetical protein
MDTRALQDSIDETLRRGAYLLGMAWRPLPSSVLHLLKLRPRLAAPARHSPSLGRSDGAQFAAAPGAADRKRGPIAVLTACRFRRVPERSGTVRRGLMSEARPIAPSRPAESPFRDSTAGLKQSARQEAIPRCGVWERLRVWTEGPPGPSVAEDRRARPRRASSGRLRAGLPAW